MAKEFYAPVLVTVAPKDGENIFTVVSDLPEDREVDLHIQAVDMSGTTREIDRFTVTAKSAGACEAIRLDDTVLKSDEIFYFSWKSGEDQLGSPLRGADIYAPNAWKTYDLLPPKIDLQTVSSGDVTEITLTAQGLGLFVSLEADVAGRFSENAFTLLSGMPHVITFTPERAGDVPKLTLRDLHSASYGETQ
jgi:beta-mannosidase